MYAVSINYPGSRQNVPELVYNYDTLYPFLEGRGEGGVQSLLGVYALCNGKHL